MLSPGRDSTTYFHAASLSRGLSTVLLANRVLIVGHARNQAAFAVARGIPSSTAQGTAALLEEQDAVRIYLRDRAIPVPDWRTFRFGDDGAGHVQEAVRELGYPVVLRPAWRSRKAIRVAHEQRLTDAITSLKRLAGRLSDRPGRPQSRYMVEQDRAGTSVELLVAHGEVRHFLLSPSERNGAGTDIQADARRLAVAAASAFPGLQVATVRLEVEHPSRELHGQHHAVSSVVADTQLRAYDRVDSGAGVRLAADILEREVELGSLPWTAAQTSDMHALTFYGLPDTTGASDALARHVAINDALEVRGLDVRTNHGLKLSVRGSPVVVADLADQAMNGEIGGVRPLRVEVHSRQIHA